MEKALVDYINAQRKEAEEFNKIPGNWMGMMPEATDVEYWSQRVPSGTLREFQRTELEEAAYYAAADGMSKSYARFISSKLSEMSDDELNKFIDEMVKLIKFDQVA
jgi:hypothetical protein